MVWGIFIPREQLILVLILKEATLESLQAFISNSINIDEATKIFLKTVLTSSFGIESNENFV